MITLQLKSVKEQFVVRSALIKHLHWLNEQIRLIETVLSEDWQENALKSKQQALEIVEDLLLEFWHGED